VDAVLDAGGVDIGDEAGEERAGEVGESVADVGAGVAVEDRLEVAVVDGDVDARDAVGVRRPADDREGAAGVVDRGEVGHVDAAERRLVQRVVDRDRPSAGGKLEDLVIARVDLHVDRVRPVRETAGEEADLEAGSDVVDARVVRIRLDDVDARLPGVRDELELIVDVELDLGDLLRVERPSLDEDDTALRLSRIRRIERTDEIGLRERSRRENQAAGNPSPHNPNLHTTRI
jgi:hypothetical protein